MAPMLLYVNSVLELVVIDLASEQINTIDIGSNPTDLDLSPDGALAVVVSRTSKELHVIDAGALEYCAEDCPSARGLVVGFRTLRPHRRAGTGIHHSQSDPVLCRVGFGRHRRCCRCAETHSRHVHHPDRSIFDGHSYASGCGRADPSGYFYGHHAISLVDLNDFRQNTLKLPAEPSGYVNGTNGVHGYFIMENINLLAQVDYETLLYEQVSLKSPPVYVGVLPDLDVADGDMPPAWVSQEHPLGRLTFFDPDDGSAETITGFELNSRIESRPCERS